MLLTNNYVLLLLLLVQGNSQIYMNISVDWNTGFNNESCWFNKVPCKTLDYAIEGVKSNTVITVSNYSNGCQYLETSATLLHVNDIIIEGGDNRAEILCNGTNRAAGLTIVNVTNLTIKSILLIGCGVLHEYVDIAPDNITYQFRSALYILNSTKILFSYITISNSTGIGLSLFDTAGPVLIENCNFFYNSVPKEELEKYPGGGGIHIEFTLCSPAVIENVTDCDSESILYIYGNNYTIVNCTFENNNATILPNSSLTYIVNYGPVVQQIGRGGGLSLSFKGMASSNIVSIDQCTFRMNNATVGGGIAVEITDNTCNNSVMIIGSEIKNNFAVKGGGGIQFGFFSTQSAVNNTILFDRVQFAKNQAGYGGGTSVYSTRTPHGSTLQNYITFRDSTWVNNEAVVGAAVLFFPEDWTLISKGYLPVPLFQDCEFIENGNLSNKHNMAFAKHDSEQLLKGGIIFSDTYCLNFSSSISIIGNLGSGIHLSAGDLNVLPSTVLTISDNQAAKGAGIVLMGYASIIAHKNATIIFQNNNALDIGGAIYYFTIDTLDFVNSRRCFLSYVDICPPEAWDAEFHFYNNTATNYGHSIYATSLEPCARASVTDGSMEFQVETVFQWSSFVFVPNLTNPHIISTSPAQISMSNKTISVPPGKRYVLPMNITDDLQQSVDAVLLATSTGVDSAFKYVSNKIIIFKGNKSSPPFSLLLQTINTRPISIDINVVLLQCPPGYIPESETCICSVLSQNIPGIPACDESRSRGMMIIGYWAGCVNDVDNTLITAQCPLGYCNYNGLNKTNGLVTLPDSCSSLEEMLCSSKNRQGWLCGECEENFTVYYHSSRFICGDCNYPELGFLFYFLSEVIPLTLLFIFVIVLDISLTSGAVDSLILFAQVLDFFGVTAFGSYVLSTPVSILTEIYWFLFGFFNLEFFRLDKLSFCLWKGATVLDVLAFKFITSFCGLFLIVSLFVIMRYCSCCRKCIRSLRCARRNDHYSVVHGLSAFLIITYSQCAKVAFQILTKVDLEMNAGSTYESVVFLSGTTIFFSKEHLKYAIPAIFVIGYTLLVPLLLTCHPIYYRGKKWMMDRSLVNSASNNQTWCSMKIASINLFLKPILDAFSGCFNDETRFFAGLFFVYRLLISAAFAFSTTAVSMYALLELIVLVMLTMNAVFQPYKWRCHNILDTLVFANLAVINGFSLYNYASTQFINEQKEHFNAIATTQLVLIYIPILYMIVFIILKVLSCYRPMRLRLKHINQYIPIFSSDQLEADEQALLQDQERDFLDEFDPDKPPGRVFENTLIDREVERPACDTNRVRLLDHRQHYGAVMKKTHNTA